METLRIFWALFRGSISLPPPFPDNVTSLVPAIQDSFIKKSTAETNDLKARVTQLEALVGTPADWKAMSASLTALLAQAQGKPI